MQKLYLILLSTLLFLSAHLIFGQDDDVDKLLDTLKQVEGEHGEIELLLQISAEYRKSDLDKARQFSERAVRQASQHADSQLYCRALLESARCILLFEEYDTVIGRIEEILPHLKGIEDREFLGQVFSVYGITLSFMGEVTEARKALDRSLAYRLEVADQGGIAESYNYIALLFKEQAEYDSAVYYYLQSSRSSVLAGDSIALVKAYGNIGKAFNFLNDPVKAKEYFLKALKILRVKKYSRFEGAIYNNLGMTYYTLENHDSAMYYYLRCQAIYSEINHSSGLGYVLQNIGAVYEKRKDYSRAKDHFMQALAIFENLHYEKGIIDANINLALVEERKGNYSEALRIYDKILVLAKEISYQESIKQIYYNIYKAHSLNGDFKQAYHYQELYHAIKDSLSNLERAAIIADLELKYGKEKDQAEIMSLRNETLQKDLQLRKRTNERNLLTSIAVTIAVLVLMLFVITRQRLMKDRIIRIKEIERLKEEKLALAAKSLVEGQEEERKRVASELHDGLGILLSTVKLQFTSIKEALPAKSELLNRASELLERASGDVRRISHNLMPGNLVRFGLFDALEDLFESLRDGKLIHAELHVKGSEKRLPENHEIMIYRMAQELVNNTLKHARASNISLLINNMPDEVILHYADDGAGFDPEDIGDGGSLGLRSIRSRVDFLNGDLQIESSPGKGAAFFIHIPLEADEVS